MLISVVESSTNKYFIGEPHLIMKNGEWEKTMLENQYFQSATSDKFTGFEVLKSDNNQLKTSLFCLQTKKNEISKISNDKFVLAVIPQSCWDNTKIAKAQEHGFFIETNGKVQPRLNPNKKHISICYTGQDNKTYTYTVFAQLKNYDKYAIKLVEKKLKFQPKTNKVGI
ncbi:MAG: hypothetical protein PHR82_08515 [Endomicrobiaceae bacterium]|nr:hypothetical protein [Endomicrobiaceae bacterium]